MDQKFIQKRVADLNQELASYQEAVKSAFNVYQTMRTDEDIGGMIQDLAYVATYRWQARLAGKELELLESVKSQEDWDKTRKQTRELSAQRHDYHGWFGKALHQLTAEYYKKCPKADKKPHEVLGVKVESR